MKNNSLFYIEITGRTILKTVLLLVLISFAWQLRGVVFMFFFSFILYSAFTPIVESLVKRGIPRILSIVIIYVVLFGIISLIMGLMTNILISQLQHLFSDLDNIMTSFLDTLIRIFPWLKDYLNPEQISSELIDNNDIIQNFVSGKNLANAFGVVSSITSIGITIFASLMLTLYMLNRKDKFYSGLLDYVRDKKKRKQYFELMRKIEIGLGNWFLGELALMILVGFATWVGLVLPGFFMQDYTLSNYALPIALLAGLLEAVPNLGPTLTAVIAAIIALGSGDMSTTHMTVVTLVQTGYVIVLGTIIQNLEAVFLVPHVMKKAVGIDPIVTILGIIGALSLFGIIGAIIVIPIIATAQIIFDYFQDLKNNDE